MLKEKQQQPRLLYPAKIPIKMEEILILGKIKAECVHYHYTCSAGNVKGSPAEWKQKMLLAT